MPSLNLPISITTSVRGRSQLGTAGRSEMLSRLRWRSPNMMRKTHDLKRKLVRLQRAAQRDLCSKQTSSCRWNTSRPSQKPHRSSTTIWRKPIEVLLRRSRTEILNGQIISTGMKSINHIVSAPAFLHLRLASHVLTY